MLCPLLNAFNCLVFPIKRTLLVSDPLYRTRWSALLTLVDATAELVIWTWYVSLCSQIEIDSRLTMWNGSIESNVVIMASCIPTLHPLLEITLGRRSLRSWSASRDNYKNSSSSMPGASYNRSKRSNPRKPDLTITNVGSQENILRLDELALSQIHRTDNVTVQYESRSGAAEERTSW